MKKIVNVFFSIVLLLFSTGCFNNIRRDSNQRIGMSRVDNIDSQNKFEYKYNLLEDMSKPIEIGIINDYTKLNNLNYALNLSVSMNNTTIDKINEICNIKQIRRVNGAKGIYYCVFKFVEDNIKPLYIYVFFEKKMLIGSINIRKKLTFNDFDSIKINYSTLEDVEKIDEAVFENTMSFYFDDSVYAVDKISNDIKTKGISFSITDKGYVKITYKNTQKTQHNSAIASADKLVIKKIENVENNLIKGICNADIVQ